MSLSNRATRLLENSEREHVSVSEPVIRRIFDQNNAPVFEALLQFQMKYGGYTFYAGLAPIRFTLLHGGGGYPESNYTAEIYFQAGNVGNPQYYFECAQTKYQMQFFLDEEGQYYEDYEVKASSFEKVIEHLALRKEIAGRDTFERFFNSEKLSVQKPEEVLGLTLIAEASDEYSQWYQNEFIYMEKWNGCTSLFVSKHYPDKEKLAELK
ncbi:hypothetical protein LZZ85_05505 [Terrimonas sp. NA20]|uniref:DUF4375 domain-containing protein n=1 Tax=Terrimonas ginsenosidimutans TaxID=2908004 RepID=A0ABS9KN28_9BACT|nr:hypothetical protein [Terrimonas ginsenosidimutans]MCG2613723.1 hypothetical protein [Terrimonas ginsenosidimutans]